MQSAPLPPTELARLAALHRLDVLDSGAESEFDALTKVASLVCEVPVALISLIDTDRQWFKSNIGLPGVTQTPRDVAFCAHAILGDRLFEVPDATQDPRFFDNPLVVADPSVRFYAGAPIVLSDGHCMGTVCVVDRQPRQLNDTQREILRSLALAAAQALEGRLAMRSQQQVQAELRKHKDFLNRTGELARVGGWEVDLRTGHVHWSDITRRIHGVDAAYEPDVAKAIAFYAPEAQPVIQAAVQAAIDSGTDWDLELPFIRQSGERIWVRAMGSVEFLDGKAVRLVGAFQDITDSHLQQVALEDARHKAEQASLSKGQFLANMSHEIRTPMNAILGMLTLLRRTEMSDQQKDYAQKAQEAARSLLGLLNDILDFSKVEAGKMTLEHLPCELGPLMRRLEVVLSASVGSKPVALSFELDPTLPGVVMGDAMRLQQVLVNLGGNAVKFTSHGQVVVALHNAGATAEGVRIRFSVTDSGIGIAPEHLAHIFDGFSQAEASTTRRFGGTGLGLAISRRLVNLMGGDIVISSTPGVGSTFAFALTMPVALAEHVPIEDVHPSQNSHQRLKGLHILVVEDNFINQQVAQELLSNEGALVAMADNGQLAVDAVTATQCQANAVPFDVVLMDLQMPVLDGFGATRAIRGQLGLTQLPIVAMTANAMDSDRDACLAAGMNAHVGKPFDLASLVTLLLRLTGR